MNKGARGVLGHCRTFRVAEKRHERFDVVVERGRRANSEVDSHIWPACLRLKPSVRRLPEIDILENFPGVENSRRNEWKNLGKEVVADFAQVLWNNGLAP